MNETRQMRDNEWGRKRGHRRDVKKMPFSQEKPSENPKKGSGKESKPEGHILFGFKRKKRQRGVDTTCESRRKNRMFGGQKEIQKKRGKE